MTKHPRKCALNWLSSLDIAFDNTIFNEDILKLKLYLLNNDDLSQYEAKENLHIHCSIGYLKGEIYIDVDTIYILFPPPNIELVLIKWPYQFLYNKALKYRLSNLYEQNISIMSLIKEKIISMFASFFNSPIEKLLSVYNSEKDARFALKCMYAYMTNNQHIKDLISLSQLIRPLSVSSTDKSFTIHFSSDCNITLCTSDKPNIVSNNFDIDQQGNIIEILNDGSERIILDIQRVQLLYLSHAPSVQKLLDDVPS